MKFECIVAKSLVYIHRDVRASLYDGPQMTQTYYSIGSAIAQPLGMSKCRTNEPKMNLTTQTAKCIALGHLHGSSSELALTLRYLANFQKKSCSKI